MTIHDEDLVRTRRYQWWRNAFFIVGTPRSGTTLVQALESNGQLPVLLGDILRGKTLSTLLGRVTVVDDKGETVDLSDFLPPAKSDEVGEDDVEAAIRDTEAKLAAHHAED